MEQLRQEITTFTTRLVWPGEEEKMLRVFQLSLIFVSSGGSLGRVEAGLVPTAGCSPGEVVFPVDEVKAVWKPIFLLQVSFNLTTGHWV